MPTNTFPTTHSDDALSRQGASRRSGQVACSMYSFAALRAEERYLRKLIREDGGRVGQRKPYLWIGDGYTTLRLEFETKDGLVDYVSMVL